MAINRITTQSITDGTITAAKVAGDMATQAELDTKLNLSGGVLTGALTTNSTVDGIDIATRDAVLTSTTTTAGAALPKAGGTMTGNLQIGSANPIAFNGNYPDIHFNSYQQGGAYRPVTTNFAARLNFHPGTGKLTLKTSASSVSAGSNYNGVEIFSVDKSGNLAVTGTVDGVDIQTLNTTANAALPKAGGTMTGNIAHAGDFSIDVGGDITLDADGGAVKLRDGGTQFGTLYQSSNDFVVLSDIVNSDLLLKVNDGGSVIPAVSFDGSEAGKATFNSSIVVGANIIGKSDHTTELGHYNNGLIKRIRMAQGGELHFGDTTTTNFLGLTEGAVNDFGDTDRLGLYYRNELKMYSNTNTLRFTMNAAGNAIFSGTVSATATATLLIINSAGTTVKTINGIG